LPPVPTKPLILIVDDAPDSRRLMSAMLTGFAEIAAAGSAAEAEEILRSRPVTLALVDLDLGTTEDGLDLCRTIKALPTEHPTAVILVSATADPETRVAGYEAGTDDFLAKPFDRRELQAKARVQLTHREALEHLSRMQRATECAAGRLTDIVEEQARGIVVARTMTARALATLAEQRDTDTGAHLDRMRDLAVVIAEEMSRDPRWADIIDGRFIEQLHHAAPLHDVGKVAVPDAILQKPGRLTADEFDIMRTHTTAGACVLEAIATLECDGGIADEVSFMPMAVAIARSHHERWDGTGYPDGLAGTDIPLEARITAAADVLDALASVRVYKAAMPLEEARTIILEGRGSHFDPDVIEAFERAWPRLVATHRRFAADDGVDAAPPTSDAPAARAA
jgi:putative two-component system response regulator